MKLNSPSLSPHHRRLRQLHRHQRLPVAPIRLHIRIHRIQLMHHRILAVLDRPHLRLPRRPHIALALPLPLPSLPPPHRTQPHHRRNHRRNHSPNPHTHPHTRARTQRRDTIALRTRSRLRRDDEVRDDRGRGCSRSSGARRRRGRGCSDGASRASCRRLPDEGGRDLRVRDVDEAAVDVAVGVVLLGELPVALAAPGGVDGVDSVAVAGETVDGFD